LDRASITIEEAFAWCRAHPVEHVDLERFLGTFTTTRGASSMRATMASSASSWIA